MKYNLFEDVLIVEYPNTPDNWFVPTQQLISPLMESIEANIERNGGYMTDNWNFVHAEEQKLRSVLSCVRVVLEGK